MRDRRLPSLGASGQPIGTQHPVILSTRLCTYGTRKVEILLARVLLTGPVREVTDGKNAEKEQK